MLTKCYIITYQGIRGTHTYNNRENAEEAAKRRYALSGQKWVVEEIWAKTAR